MMKKRSIKHIYLFVGCILLLSFHANAQFFPAGNLPGGMRAPQIVDQDSTTMNNPNSVRSSLYKVPDMYGIGWRIPINEILSGRHYPDTIYVNGVEVLLAFKRIKPILTFPVITFHDTTLNKLGNMTFRYEAFKKFMLTDLISLLKIEKQRSKEEEISVEIDGLVIDETLSKVGRDFYEAFYSKWVAPLNAKDYTIFVKESPPRMNRFMVAIYVNEDEVFSSYLAPREEIINAYADYAVSQTEKYLEQRENVSQALESPDMAGSGIY